MKITILDNDNNEYVEIKIKGNDLSDIEILNIVAGYGLKVDGKIKAGNDDGNNSREFIKAKMPDVITTPQLLIDAEIYEAEIRATLREMAIKEIEKNKNQ
jgi:hypothetical protein